MLDLLFNAEKTQQQGAHPRANRVITYWYASNPRPVNLFGEYSMCEVSLAAGLLYQEYLLQYTLLNLPLPRQVLWC